MYVSQQSETTELSLYDKKSGRALTGCTDEAG